MKLLLDLVHDDSNNSSHNYDDDVNRPLQLIRPMPDQLSDYITTRDYEDFCIQKIDPLLGALYETEKSAEEWWSILITVLLVTFIGMFSMGFLFGVDLIFEVAPILMCIGVCFFVAGFLMNCNFPGRRLHDAIRRECRDMADRCNTKNSTTNKNTTIGFELVLKRVWRGFSRDSNGQPHHPHYDWKARNIRVSITDNSNTDDMSNDYQHL